MINYDLPIQPENYLHRIERSGRTWEGNRASKAVLERRRRRNASAITRTSSNHWSSFTFPLLLGLQVEDSEYVFEAKTIQRIDFLVLSTLQWKMNPVTPLSFIDLIIRRLGLKTHRHWELLHLCKRFLFSVIDLTKPDLMNLRDVQIVKKLGDTVDRDLNAQGQQPHYLRTRPKPNLTLEPCQIFHVDH